MQKDNINKEGIIKDIKNNISEISKEFQKGFELLERYPKSITIFGSARLSSDSSHYKEAQNLSERISKETDYAVLTGGGPGIMEAANRGAHSVNGKSIGINITLPREQHINQYVSDSIALNYFFVRKSLMVFASECYIFFPGGFGTFDELFGILTLLQTSKIPKVPVILFGKDFWNPVKELIEAQMLNRHHTINEDDLNLFIITDSMDRVIKIIKEAPVSEWWNIID